MIALGLHPSTNGQAVLANILVGAINTAAGASVEPLPSREIIADLMGLNPDQPYLDWAAARGLTDPAMAADEDGDGLPNLGEYLLGLDPKTAGDGHFATVRRIAGNDYLTLRYTPDADALRLAEAAVTYSTDLAAWQSLPPGAWVDLGNGSHEARLPLGGVPGGASRAFMRLEITLKP